MGIDSKYYKNRYDDKKKYIFAICSIARFFGATEEDINSIDRALNRFKVEDIQVIYQSQFLIDKNNYYNELLKLIFKSL